MIDDIREDFVYINNTPCICVVCVLTGGDTVDDIEGIVNINNT